MTTPATIRMALPTLAFAARSAAATVMLSAELSN